ncbi:ubiquitin-conjugating enzyme/RWD-like protein [Cristinia sonorae]|uniref:E2 ubiquitin-conjugating enzyme n=1 Tax=Cristinia sonorae TaxID=1940300 RepID=A0A8K0XJQ7_9AGAR|nr:ubiquitin-conjugating enzyme/RWD-like protein [Cristinia sonorae]
MPVTPAAMRRLMREITQLQTSPPEGIRVVAGEDNMLDVTGIIEGPEGTPYAGGYFRIKFNFTEEFPAAPPKCRFISKIFHPNVSSAGEICVNTLKKDWNSSYGIGHILVTVKCLLIYPNPESALDEEAGKLLLEDYESYCARARLITSVHCTPKTRPPEFDTPSADSESAPSGSNTALKASNAAEAPVPTLVASTSAKSLASAAPPVTHPLKSSASNTLTTSSSTLSDKTGTKERLSSPSPLGTADSNVAAASPVEPAAATAKATKRGAGNIPAGMEKRKKALKRL